MQVFYSCPGCLRQIRTPAEVPAELRCPDCGWKKGLTAEQRQTDPPTECLVCSCHDLWRQKDFPQRVGVTMVALGAILSTIAWSYYMPLLSIGILLFFALIDLLLYLFMPDVLVCYRCQARYRRPQGMEGVEYFNLETAERYRQEKIRLEESQGSQRERV